MLWHRGPPGPWRLVLNGRSSSMAGLVQRQALDFALAKIAAANLARDRHRKLVHALELTRVFVRREPGLHVLLNLVDHLLRGLMARQQFDERLDRLAAPLIRYSHHRARPDRRMLDHLGLA